MFKKLILTTLASLLITGCASILSKTTYPVRIETNPSGAEVSIVNRNGAQVFSGETPVIAELDSGSSFFSREHYQLLFKRDGFKKKVKELRASIDPWYWGNFAIGGLLGFLIIDPLTGAMFEFDDLIVVTDLEGYPPSTVSRLKDEATGTTTKLSS